MASRNIFRTNRDSAAIDVIVRPFQAFAEHRMSGGILLLLAAIIALIWANSPAAASYEALWHTNLTISFAGRALSRSLHFWVNDFLMALFFFVVGLEIKREVLVGELAEPRQAALPILAALGGVIVPILIYAGLNAGGAGSHGWGVPMATDIAFALGAMALLGERIPAGLTVFLTALAIADDLAAVLAIAIFYTKEISFSALAVAGLCLALLILINLLGVRHPLAYATLGVALWISVLLSGVHATVAGILLALTIPSRTPLNPKQFLERSTAILNRFERAAHSKRSVINDEEQQSAIKALEEACEEVQPPLHRFEHALQPWVTYLIMPLFALANAGLVLQGNLRAQLAEPVTLGVGLGLLLGKPLGITAASWLAVRAKVASLPAGVGWRHIHGAAWLAGIGFTMALFLGNLAFDSEHLLSLAKLGILGASLLAGCIGSLLLLKSAA